MSNPAPDEPVIQVVLPPGLRTWLEELLATRGLYLFPIPWLESDPPTYGVGIHT